MEAASKGVWQVWGTVGGAGQRQPGPATCTARTRLGRGGAVGNTEENCREKNVGHRSRGKLGMPVPMLTCFIERSAL